MDGQYIEPVLLSRLIATPALPSLCAVCCAWGTHGVCASCLARFSVPVQRCDRCALQLPPGANAVCGACLREAPPYERCVAALDYAYPWDALIARFKFACAVELAPVLAQLLLAAVQRSGAARPGLLLPVPLSPQRLRQRGYNQAWELARRLAPELHGAADAHLLLRVKDTPHQLALPLKSREANVRGAFAVEPRRRVELRDINVALVDDVMTTGATAAEAARVLLQAGAASVQVWVLARTPRPEDQ